MNGSKHKTLTTGQIAHYCDVAPITVARWIESGKLQGHQFPGGGHRRVLVKNFMAFLIANDLPCPEELRTARRILVIEDEAPVAMEIEEALVAAGFETMAAGSGFEAGRMLAAFNPDIITLDLRMPGLSGLDVLRNLRADSTFENVKVLVISAMPSAELDEALAAGANEVMRKPVDGAKVVRCVERMLGASPRHGDTLRTRAAEYEPRAAR